MKSFEHDGVTLNMSGYDTVLNSRGNATAGKPISRHKYYAVYRDGDANPTDLVREQPSGKLISIIDTKRERAHSKKAGWQVSAFKYSEEQDHNFVELTFEEVQDILKGGIKGFGRAKRATTKRRSYTADQKRVVLEALATGSTPAAVERLYGIPAATAKSWARRL